MDEWIKFYNRDALFIKLYDKKFVHVGRHDDYFMIKTLLSALCKDYPDIGYEELYNEIKERPFEYYSMHMLIYMVKRIECATYHDIRWTYHIPSFHVLDEFELNEDIFVTLMLPMLTDIATWTR